MLSAMQPSRHKKINDYPDQLKMLLYQKEVSANTITSIVKCRPVLTP